MIFSSVYFIVGLFTIALVGLAINFGFILLNVKKANLRNNNYYYMLFAMAVLNCLYLINMGFLQPLVIFYDLDENGVYCTVLCVWVTITGVGDLCLLPVLSINRYIEMTNPRKQIAWFSDRNKAIIMFCIFVFVLIFSLVAYVLDEFGRLQNSICAIDVGKFSTFQLVAFVSPLFVCYAVTGVFMFKILKIIRSHKNTAYRMRFRKRARKASEILKLIVAEITLPALLQSFSVIYLICLTLGNKITYYQTLLEIFVCLYEMHTITDVIMIVVILKPYRNVVRNHWFMIKFKVTKNRPGQSLTPKTTTVNLMQSQNGGVDFVSKGDNKLETCF